MVVLVTGATGYIGGAVAGALRTRGHEVHGLARSEGAAALLRERSIAPVFGDFGDPATLSRAVEASDPDAVVSTASLGSLGGNADSFARDRDGVRALRDALGSSGKPLIFTSGSAVFGSFNGGESTSAVYDETARLPLPSSVLAPKSAHVPPLIAAGLEVAMKARVETEEIVIGARDLRGVVVRPGLVYGHGGSFDVPALIKLSRLHGHGVHLGSGATLQSYVHIDDLVDLYCLAVEEAPSGGILHGVTAEVSQRDLAVAVSRMIGADGRTESVAMPRMLGLDLPSRVGLNLTRKLSPAQARRLQAVVPTSDSVGTGVSLCLNKRLSADRTRQLLGWNPSRTDILEDIAVGSYAL